MRYYIRNEPKSYNSNHTIVINTHIQNVISRHLLFICKKQIFQMQMLSKIVLLYVIAYDRKV